jgi:hypothetical protein
VTEVQPTPDVEIIDQHPDANVRTMLPIPVEIKGDSYVTVLPSRTGQFKYLAVMAAGDFDQIIDANPKIRRFWIAPSATGVIVGTELEVKAAKNSASVNAGIPAGWSPAFEGVHDAVWAYSPGGGQSIVMRLEYWAD